MICGNAEGSTTKRKICQRPAPIDWAARNASTAQERDPACAFTIMMRKTDRKISRIFDISPMPNHRMNSGMRPSGGIGRTISDGTRNSASISGIRPAQQADDDAQRRTGEEGDADPRKACADMSPDADAGIAALDHVEEARCHRRRRRQDDGLSPRPWPSAGSKSSRMRERRQDRQCDIASLRLGSLPRS